MIKSLPQEIACIPLLAPQADSSVTSAVVSLKNANKAWVKAICNQGAVANQCTITLRQATTIAGSTNAALANNVPIWYDEDFGASDALAAGTAAKAYQFNNTQSKIKIAWFEIDPANVFTSGYDCIYCTSSGSNAANIISVEIFIEPKSKAAILDSFIVD